MLQDRVQYNTARTRRNSRFVKRQAVCLKLPTGSPRAGAWCQPCSLEGELQGIEQLTKQLQGKLPKSFANSYVNTMRDARLSTLSKLSPLVYSHMAFLCLCPASGALDIPYFHYKPCSFTGQSFVWTLSNGAPQRTSCCNGSVSTSVGDIVTLALGV
jgi:hypothetical protein